MADNEWAMNGRLNEVLTSSGPTQSLWTKCPDPAGGCTWGKEESKGTRTTSAYPCCWVGSAEAEATGSSRDQKLLLRAPLRNAYALCAADLAKVLDLHDLGHRLLVEVVLERGLHDVALRHASGGAKSHHAAGQEGDSKPTRTKSHRTK